MAILIASGKSLKLEVLPGFDKISVKDAFGEIEDAPVTAGRARTEKGWLLENFTYPHTEIQYITKGTETIEAEGKTYVAHEGDFVCIPAGTTVTSQGAPDEDFELIVITIPSLKTVGLL